MSRIFAFAAATLIAAPAVAQDSQPDNYGQLEAQLQAAMQECGIEMDDEAFQALTLSQVSGIVIASTSSDSSEVCEEIESIAMGATVQ